MGKDNDISNKIVLPNEQIFDHSLTRKLHNKSIKVIIPTLNEEKTIADIIHRLHLLGLYDILVIDGHSQDNTVKYARKLGAKVIIQDGLGKGNGLREAFKKIHDSKIIVMIDADGSMAPEELPFFLYLLDSGADIVKGSRFLCPGNSDDFTLIRRIGNKILTAITNFFFLTKYTDLCYGYMVFKREALIRLAPLLKGDEFEIETEICIQAKSLGLTVIEIPSYEYARLYGTSNLQSFKDGLNIFKLILINFFNRNGCTEAC